ncbi:hypothetical protein NC652_012179 [Populus alba x Populus x berolinensis]|nr:hypothetical protein NC652_012179 [Populus alba x Populus x berolinensis]
MRKVKIRLSFHSRTRAKFKCLPAPPNDELSMITIVYSKLAAHLFHHTTGRAASTEDHQNPRARQLSWTMTDHGTRDRKQLLDLSLKKL